MYIQLSDTADCSIDSNFPLRNRHFTFCTKLYAMFCDLLSKVGTNMSTLHLSRKDTLEMRELGGSMAPIWNKYYKNCDAVIVSVSNFAPLLISVSISASSLGVSISVSN